MIGPVAIVVLVLLGVVLLRRRRQRHYQRQAETSFNKGEANNAEKAQLHGDSLPIPNPVFEMDAMQEMGPQELATVERAQELHDGGHH